MRASFKRSIAAGVAALALAVSTPLLQAQALLSHEDAAKTLAIEKLSIEPTGVSGVVVNRSAHVIRDAEIMVQYHWLWDNEFKPGANPPGETVFVRLPNELKPGDSAPFRHTTTLPDRKDGRLVPEVTVAGFTVVVPPR